MIHAEQGSRIIETVEPSEFEKYHAVPAWRVWYYDIFLRSEYVEKREVAEIKPFALTVCKGYRKSKAFDYVYKKVDPKSERCRLNGAINDHSIFLLEPLTKTEIEEVNKRNKSEELRSILSSDDLKIIFNKAKERKLAN